MGVRSPWSVVRSQASFCYQHYRLRTTDYGLILIFLLWPCCQPAITAASEVQAGVAQEEFGALAATWRLCAIPEEFEPLTEIAAILPPAAHEG